MAAPRCPGMDRARWKPEDITELPCPRCGQSVEFMKDERSRKCPNCGARFGDPGKDIGCAQWCAYAKECLGAVDPLASKEAVARKWVCPSCGYVYDPEKGDPGNGAPPGTAWEELPEDWRCPLCAAGKGRFEGAR